MITAQQTKFIERRAKGMSLTQIATELNVCKRTLINWGHKLQAELQEEHLLEQEALREQLIGLPEERLRRQGELLARVEAELQKRSLADLSTARLFTMAESLRRQILKETSTKLPAMPAPDEQAVESETDDSLLPLAQITSMPINSQPETINEPEDRCKNGATSRSEPSLPQPPVSRINWGCGGPETGAAVLQPCEPTRITEASSPSPLPPPFTPVQPANAWASVEDQCKNGAISVQSPPNSIPSPPAPLLGERVPQAGEGGTTPIPSQVEEQGQGEEKQQSLAQSASMPINHQPVTINPVPQVEPLFKHRVLTEDLGRELRRHYARAK